MTVGLTGVVWLPRGAEVNSAALSAGAGPVPLTGAGTAWAGVASALADAGATLARVSAELGAGWQGAAATAAIGKMAPLTEWAGRAVELAGDTAVKANLQSSAYTVAALAMPSAPEIAAVKAAKVAAYSTAGAAGGAIAAAEAAEVALDLRAAAVMEAYEGASNILAVQRAFDAPPRVVTSEGESPQPEADQSPAGGEAEGSAAGAPSARSLSAAADPVQTVSTLAGDPAAQSAARSLAGSGASVAGNAVSAASGLAGGAAGPSASPPAGPVAANALGAGNFGAGNFGAGSFGAGGLGVGAMGVGAFGAGAAPAPTPVPAAKAMPGSGISVPEGWGSSGSGSAAASSVASPAAAGSPASGGGGAGLLGPRGVIGADDEESARERPEYLDGIGRFIDGRSVVPPVLGEDEGLGR
jgi:PPE-repeat protein